MNHLKVKQEILHILTIAVREIMHACIHCRTEGAAEIVEWVCKYVDGI